MLKIMKFYADWCQPCRMMSPIVENVVSSMSDTVELENIDIDVRGDEASRMGVSAVPTLVFVKDGVVAGALVGMHKEQAIVDLINKLK